MHSANRLQHLVQHGYILGVGTVAQAKGGEAHRFQYARSKASAPQIGPESAGIGRQVALASRGDGDSDEIIAGQVPLALISLVQQLELHSAR